jgi:hypothetical protein
MRSFVFALATIRSCSCDLFDPKPSNDQSCTYDAGATDDGSAPGFPDGGCHVATDCPESLNAANDAGGTGRSPKCVGAPVCRSDHLCERGLPLVEPRDVDASAIPPCRPVICNADGVLVSLVSDDGIPCSVPGGDTGHCAAGECIIDMLDGGALAVDAASDAPTDGSDEAASPADAAGD